jgi:propionyl-CoA synthetase
MNLHTFDPKPGSATKPCPGFKIEILDSEHKVLEKKSLGKVCIKLPMPPSFMLTLYNNDQAFLDKYMLETPGYYTTGDGGYFDEDGYLNIMTRLDDIINTAGHRLSTASMEEVLITGGKVVEAAVVAKIEELKGEVPVGFVVLKSGVDVKGIEKELIGLIRK